MRTQWGRMPENTPDAFKWLWLEERENYDRLWIGPSWPFEAFDKNILKSFLSPPSHFQGFNLFTKHALTHWRWNWSGWGGFQDWKPSGFEWKETRPIYSDSSVSINQSPPFSANGPHTITQKSCNRWLFLIMLPHWLMRFVVGVGISSIYTIRFSLFNYQSNSHHPFPLST